MKLNEIFGNNIKYFRYQKGYSQRKVGKLVNCCTTYISQLEMGMHTPSFEKMEELARVLEVEPAELLVPRSISTLPDRIDKLESYDRLKK